MKTKHEIFWPTRMPPHALLHSNQPFKMHIHGDTNGGHDLPLCIGSLKLSRAASQNC